MDPLTLAQYFTLFPSHGILKPLSLFRDGNDLGFLTRMAHVSEPYTVFEARYADLVTKILSDRYAGVEQFGLASNLNLSQNNVAVKTGTSRDYHDSWTVGYTPDFVVVTWLGNAENKALKKITGAIGAGSIWKDTMEILFQTPYNKHTPFTFSEVEPFTHQGSLVYGLSNDVLDEHIALLTTSRAILSPQQNDLFQYEPRMKIPLRARTSVTWQVNNVVIGIGTTTSYTPPTPGTYNIRALVPGGTEETLSFRVVP
jgi:membrane peptidoglycan carboxypeptidase